MFDRKTTKRDGVEITTGFPIPNKYCRFHSAPLGCEHDGEFHTCCQEECRISEVLFSEKTEIYQRLWDNNVPFKHKTVSILYMWIHPKKCLKLVKYALRIIIYFKVKTEFTGHYKPPKPWPRPPKEE